MMADGNSKRKKAASKARLSSQRPAKGAKTASSTAKAKRPAKRKSARASKGGKQAKTRTGNKVVLLSGGNPQIAKGYGEAPVEAYLAAMPGWKQDIGRRMDEIIGRIVPGVRKAVKWNSPFYGAPGDDRGWFLSFHCFSKYVKVTFFRGTSLDPVPAGTSKHPTVRYLDIYEGQFDETQFTDWVKQASQIPGERM